MTATVRVVQRREILGLPVADQRYRANQQQGVHQHEQGYVNVVVAGRYVEHSGNRSRPCSPASIIIRPAGEPHATTIGDVPVRCLRIEMSDVWLREHQLAHALQRPSRDVGLLRSGASSRRIFRHFAANNDLADASFALELGGVLLGDDPHFRSAAPRWLDDVIDTLRANFLQSVRVAQLALLTDVSPIHLGRLFRRHTGSTIPGFVLRLRTEYACGLLLESDAPLSVVSYQAGFVDQSHLTRALVRLTGMTPAAYRREARSAVAVR